MKEPLMAQSVIRQQYPVSFQLIGNEKLNTLYISSDRHKGQIVTLKVSNIGGRILHLEKQPEGVDPHFVLMFRPHTFEELPAFSTEDLNQARIRPSVLPADWEVAVTQEGLNFNYRGNKPLKWEPEKSISFTLQYQTVRGLFGSRSTKVTLKYNNLQVENSEDTLTDYSQVQVDIIQLSVAATPPFTFFFLEANTIQNGTYPDTVAELGVNELTVRLKNSLDVPLKLSPEGDAAETRFILSFDHGDIEDALCDENEVKQFKIACDWGEVDFNSQGAPQFTIQSISRDHIPPEGYLDFKIKNIRTSHPSGVANMYLQYENIPDFSDGRLVLPIEKTPLVTRGRSVGIGVNPDPNYRMLVEGNVRIQAGNKQKELFTVTAQQGQPYFEVADDGQVSIAKGLLLKGDLHADQLNTNRDINTSGKIQENGHDLMPSGAIIMWGKEEIPKGWLLCDGSEGTPDLREKFVVGATRESGRTSEYGLDKKGGAPEVSLTNDQMPSHTHGGNTTETDIIRSADKGKYKLMTPGTTDVIKLKGGNRHGYHREDGGKALELEDAIQTKHDHILNINDTGGGQPHENRPPFYALYYIMKQ